jgi:excisionase family DNA binding protein
VAEESTRPEAGESPEIAELRLYTIEEAQTMLRLGKTKIFDLLRNGRLRSVREGRAHRIPPRAIAEYIALLEREAAEDAA